jgi:hypothetical protein
MFDRSGHRSSSNLRTPELRYNIGQTLQETTIMANRIYIYLAGPEDLVIDFAAQELKSYLTRMTGVQAIEIARQIWNSSTGPGELWLGLFDAFGLADSQVKDPAVDDALSVQVQDGAGVLAGSNPRSVLYAVYRLLESAGCRWVRHGADGEYIPKADISQLQCSLQDAASYRYRALCIEGSVSIENMLDNIAWAPKMGYNGYFLEFMTPYTFFERWYSHKNNPFKQPEPLTVEQVEGFRIQMEAEIKRRGMMYHAVGHGWTCEPLGIKGLGWDPEAYSIPPEIAQYFALVDGKREIYQGVPLNTQLCYSNPEARRIMTDGMVQHLEKNPHIDVLHIWLADNYNNFCECENCQKELPADLYVKMLNELDEKLSQKNIHARIIFIVYLELLWAPLHERLRNQERFLLLFAPITRTYSLPYDIDPAEVTLTPYVRNQVTLPQSVRENVAYLKEWQKGFHGDGMVYEYHFMWDHLHDPGYYAMARVLHEDIRRLRKLGLNGMISDQCQRSFFPTGFGMHVMARTLWNEQAEFDQLADEYFAGAYGHEGKTVQTYMQTLSTLFDPALIRTIHPRRGRQERKLDTIPAQEKAVILERYAQIPAVVHAFRPVIHRNLTSETNPCRRASWRYLDFHADIVERLAAAFKALFEGNPTQARRQWKKAAEIAQRNEDELQSVLDVFEFITVLGRKFS